jgi:hypothetical protein
VQCIILTTTSPGKTLKKVFIPMHLDRRPKNN